MEFKNVTSVILGIAGCAGVIGTAYMAAKEAPSAKVYYNMYKKEDDTIFDKFKLLAPKFKKTAAVGAATVLCIAGSTIASTKELNKLVCSYGLLEQAYNKYKDRVIKVAGNAADKVVEKSIEEDKNVGPNEIPWYDLHTVFFFDDEIPVERTKGEIVTAEYNINRMFSTAGDVTYNEARIAYGLEPVDGGDEIGWNLYDGECQVGYNWVDFEHVYGRFSDGSPWVKIKPVIDPHHPYTEYSVRDTHLIL